MVTFYINDPKKTNKWLTVQKTSLNILNCLCNRLQCSIVPFLCWIVFVFCFFFPFFFLSILNLQNLEFHVEHKLHKLAAVALMLYFSTFFYYLRYICHMSLPWSAGLSMYDHFNPFNIWGHWKIFSNCNNFMETTLQPSNAAILARTITKINLRSTFTYTCSYNSHGWTFLSLL